MGRKALLQLRVLGLGFFQDWDVEVCVFPDAITIPLLRWPAPSIVRRSRPSQGAIALVMLRR